MDVLVNYLTRYSPPVVATLVCLFIGGYFVKYGIEKTLEAEFQKRDRQLELAMKRQSNFQEKILWEKYIVLTSQNEELHKLRAEINKVIITKPEKILFKEGVDIPRLTAVYEQLNINRFLIGEEIYRLMRKQGRLLMAFSKLNIKDNNDKKSIEAYKKFQVKFKEVDEQYRNSMQLTFNIDNGPAFNDATSNEDIRKKELPAS